MNTQNTILDKLNALNFDLDLAYYYEDGQTFQEFEDAILEAINGEEIIYYAKAMEYLTNNDTSLNRSLEIASELGFTTENLNSELLATLVHQEDLREQYYEIQNEIEEIFEAEEIEA